ncbi:CotS family spore coat protein [Clostridiaceae bacterium M8S5]|nr:CotS family spore coat protein [Clostridiaceae bacterium M8S5]
MQTKTDLIQLAKIVLSQYNITSDNITIMQNEGIKTLWKVVTDDSKYCLKRLKQPHEKCIFTVNAQIHIYNQGGKVPKIYKNENNEPITYLTGESFVLYSFITNKTLNFKNNHHLSLALKGLAHFHKHSLGYIPPKECKISSKVGRMPSQYVSMRNRMAKWKSIALANKTSTNNTYVKHVDSIICLADEVLKLLNHSKYELLTDFENHCFPLCHQDYGSGNVLCHDNDFYVIDLDGVTYDLPTRDLRKILGKRMSKNSSLDNNFINTMLDCYTNVYPLSVDEIELLLIDMMFPHWFFADVKNIFKKNKNVEPSKINNTARFEHKKFNILQDMLKGGIL